MLSKPKDDPNKNQYICCRRIDGHKILVQVKSPAQIQIPMNSNSENPIYLCGRINKKTGAVEIVSIGIYKDHKLVKSIDLVYDSKGNIIPYQSGKKSSHEHVWSQDGDGTVGRRSGQSSNHHPIEPKYKELIQEVTGFNKEKYIWHKS